METVAERGLIARRLLPVRDQAAEDQPGHEGEQGQHAAEILLNRSAGHGEACCSFWAMSNWSTVSAREIGQ